SSDVDPPESLPKWMKCLTYSLKELEIRENHELRYLSPGIQYLTSLQQLRIVTCGELIETSDWICNLSSLKQLLLWHCPNLKSLPGSISSLTSLRFLWIYNCPTLLERCQRANGEDWPKIQHIPIVQLR
ncbi:LRR domain containing protein, partial [Parasponia andersonii]